MNMRKLETRKRRTRHERKSDEKNIHTGGIALFQDVEGGEIEKPPAIPVDDLWHDHGVDDAAQTGEGGGGASVGDFPPAAAALPAAPGAYHVDGPCIPGPLVPPIESYPDSREGAAPTTPDEDIHVVTPIDIEEERRQLEDDIERDLRMQFAAGEISATADENSVIDASAAVIISRTEEEKQMENSQKSENRIKVFGGRSMLLTSAVCFILSVVVLLALGLTGSFASGRKTSAEEGIQGLQMQSQSSPPSSSPSGVPSLAPTAFWYQIGPDIDGFQDNDEFGQSVSLSGNGTRMAVGAHRSNWNGFDSGQVKVFDFVDGDWKPVGSDINGRGEGDFFGYSVSLSVDGTRVAIGAPNYSPRNFRRYVGYVRVFDLVDSDWEPVGPDIFGEKDSYTGSSVELSADGKRLVVGARLHESGHYHGYRARVFEFSNDQWIPVGETLGKSRLAQSQDVSISADGSVVAVAEVSEDEECGDEVFAIRSYNFSDGNWTQMDIEDESITGLSSVSLSTDGKRLAVGIAEESLVNIYYFSEIGWERTGQMTGEGSWGEFGVSVSLAADGNRIVIGDSLNDNNETAPFAIGHARIFDFLGGEWTQAGSDIDGETAYEYAGHSVSIAADGLHIAVGSPGTSAGRVRVYRAS